MDNFLERLKEWYLTIKDEVFDRYDTFYVDEGKGLKIPFVYVEDICDEIFGNKEYNEYLGKEINKLQLFNDLLIEKLERVQNGKETDR